MSISNFSAAVHARGCVLLAGLLCTFNAFSAMAPALAPWSGDPAPALVLKDTQGVTHDLTRYRGKVVLINFWATWCIPCREEMPSMQRLRDRLSGKPFVVLAVNV